jgi:hypothetical protein
MKAGVLANVDASVNTGGAGWGSLSRRSNSGILNSSGPSGSNLSGGSLSGSGLSIGSGGGDGSSLEGLLNFCLKLSKKSGLSSDSHDFRISVDALAS